MSRGTIAWLVERWLTGSYLISIDNLLIDWTFLKFIYTIRVLSPSDIFQWKIPQHDCVLAGMDCKCWAGPTGRSKAVFLPGRGTGADNVGAVFKSSNFSPSLLLSWLLSSLIPSPPSSQIFPPVPLSPPSPPVGGRSGNGLLYFFMYIYPSMYITTVQYLSSRKPRHPDD